MSVSSGCRRPVPKSDDNSTWTAPFVNGHRLLVATRPKRPISFMMCGQCYPESRLRVRRELVAT